MVNSLFKTVISFFHLNICKKKKKYNLSPSPSNQNHFHWPVNWSHDVVSWNVKVRTKWIRFHRQVFHNIQILALQLVLPAAFSQHHSHSKAKLHNVQTFYHLLLLVFSRDWSFSIGCLSLSLARSLARSRTHTHTHTLTGQITSTCQAVVAAESSTTTSRYYFICLHSIRFHLIKLCRPDCVGANTVNHNSIIFKGQQ